MSDFSVFMFLGMGFVAGMLFTALIIVVLFQLEQIIHTNDFEHKE